MINDTCICFTVLYRGSPKNIASNDVSNLTVTKQISSELTYCPQISALTKLLNFIKTFANFVNDCTLIK